ncbi:MAG: DUF4397 domain-containing protein [Eubacteriales bacterium]|jgi:hypothetical protein
MNNSTRWPCYSGMPALSDSYVRLLHASPDTPPVDINADGNMIMGNLAFEQITEYVPVNPGEYRIQVYPAGQTDNPLIDTIFTVPPERSYTLALVGRMDDVGLLPISEAYLPMVDRRSTYVRFVHLVPGAPEVDVTLPDGTRVFREVGYRQHSNYIPLNPGSYTLVVRVANGMPLLTIPNVRFSPGVVYSVYAVGLPEGEPSLGALVATDGEY